MIIGSDEVTLPGGILFEVAQAFTRGEWHISRRAAAAAAAPAAAAAAAAAAGRGYDGRSLLHF